jgi:UDP-2-acetamido-2,6-beta-L-arabino-hexul-4-ose reductase
VKVLVTGADGFIGKNLTLRVSTLSRVQVISFTRANEPRELETLVQGVDFVFHLAGINRPQDPAEFDAGNSELTGRLCNALEKESLRTGRRIPVAYTSSTQAAAENAYGVSKRRAEELLRAAEERSALQAIIFRLPNVFGKWARPNYNSAVATFCHNIARGLPIQVHRPDAPLTLLYVDDLVDMFLSLLDGHRPSVDDDGFALLQPEYSTTVGAVAEMIESFKDGRTTLAVERVGKGLPRALYATYVSYLPCAAFSYPVPLHGDSRGVFVEFLKTADSGQFSFFSAHPDITRGGHFHDSKTEKFLVVKGRAKFRFRHMSTGEFYEVNTSAEKPEVVETVPGWTHDITNIGDDEMFVVLWANEVFDRERPDTYSRPLQ